LINDDKIKPRIGQEYFIMIMDWKILNGRSVKNLGV
jgi:hypothetical protein